MDQLGEIFDSMVDEMTTGMADNDLVRFVLQSQSLDYPISLPFMPRREVNAERIMGEVQRVLQSNENVNLEDGMHIHLVHVGMPQGGVAVRKRKHYGFKLSQPNEWMPPLGDYLGELTNELDDDDHITTFVSGGPKNYAYQTKNGKSVCKVRGFTLNH